MSEQRLGNSAPAPARPLVAVSHWITTRARSFGWQQAGLLALAGLMSLPVLTVAFLAVTSPMADWAHLSTYVLPRAVTQTLLLATGVALVSAVMGTAAAWLVTMHRFPGRDVLDRLLIIPLAMPTYIVAYCYVEVLDYGGPVQSAVRVLTGAQTARDYWFPDIRSLPGAILIMSVVLYPYVYLAARASFLQQSVGALEVARTLGRTEWGAFWAVGLPMARPAIMAGTALAMMECLNDLGAVEYLGVESLAATIYATWIQRSSLGGATQVATIMLLFVFVLFSLERAARGAARFENTVGKFRPIGFSRLAGWRGWAATVVCLLPFLLGFVVPAGVLVQNTIAVGSSIRWDEFVSALHHSLTLASLAAAAAVLVGLLLAYTHRVAPGLLVRATLRLAGLGYAIPGTVLGLGLLFPLAGLDDVISGLTQYLFGIRLGQLLSGTMLTLVLAYTIRYLAVSLGTIEAGFQRISPSLDAAARVLGERRGAVLLRLHVPMLMPALGAAALLVFVDTMKELPATLLLRPFNFETLATQVYNNASLAQFEQASLSALAIVFAGLIPVLLLHKAMASGQRN